MKKIRLLLADDHAILRAGLRMLLDAQPDMVVVGEAADGEDAVRRAHATRPDVAVVDLTMPRLGGVETLQRLRRELPVTRLLVLTMHDDPAYARVAFAAGAAGHVVKDSESTELLTAIRTVHRGGTFARPGPEPPPAAVATEAPPRLPPLSPRERQVLELLARGHTNREVADLLSLSVKTVETHRARLSDKLALNSRADIVRIAVSLGLFGRS
ncbi:MAG TPA: response regulator transcription factor [Candidatus Acidoferrum sp.]|jgi:DNA-binding NarL/FixJ family response regulator|nr:response regulator transcription factor [Candidatus Acidoferrum sp.]